MITSKQRTLIGLAALLTIASIQACGGTDDPSTSLNPTAGAAGAHTGAAGMGVGVGGAATSGAGAPAGGAPTSGAGAPAGGAPAFGAGAGGASAGAPATPGAGSGGASAGSGSGSSAGSGGHGGSAGGSAGAGGGGTATYAAVKAIFTASCGKGDCHDGKKHTDYQKGDLFTILTTKIPTSGGPSTISCKGSTILTPGDTNSLLVKVITNPGKTTTCQNSGQSQMIERMPYLCGQNALPGAPANPACLSAADIKTITDWVAGGALH